MSGLEVLTSRNKLAGNKLAGIGKLAKVASRAGVKISHLISHLGQKPNEYNEAIRTSSIQEL